MKCSDAQLFIKDHANTIVSKDALSEKDKCLVIQSCNNTGMFHVNTDSVQTLNVISTFSHHIHLCPPQSNKTLGTPVFNNLITLYMSFATSPHGGGDEVQETTCGVDEKEDNVNETLVTYPPESPSKGCQE